MRRRWARRSATISTRRSIRRRRCAGPIPASPKAIRRCPQASKPLAVASSRRRPNWRAVSPRSASSPKERGAELVSQLKTGQRLVSLEGDVWRWDGFVAAAHAPTGAARRLAERARLVDIENELEQARIEAAAKRQALETAEAELKIAAAAEDLGAATPGAPRSARPMPRANAMPRPNARSTATRARKSALTEAHSRLDADRAEAYGRARDRDRGAGRIAAEPRYRRQACRGPQRHRRPSPARRAGARRSAGAGARGGTGRPPACRRSSPNRTSGRTRKESAASQIATIEARITEVTAERAELDNAPAVFAEKRRALINEIESAESARRVAADALATAENVMAETDRAAKISLEALSSAREACARAEERMEGARRRLDDIEREIHDMLEVEPHAVAGLAEIEPGRRTAAAGRDRGKPRKAAPRPRAARRRQPARRGRTARGRGPAHRADHRARRSGRSHQAAAPGHPEPQPRGARAAADLVRDRQRAISSGCSSNCSAAAKPRCT